jgi:U3 small nucleolar RNA-associated protein 4
LNIEGEESISAATLSQDGQLLAVSSSSATRLFRIIRNDHSIADRVKVRNVKLEKSLPGASSLQFSPDKKWLSLVSYNNEVLLFRLKHGVKPSRQQLRLVRTKRGADTSSLQAYRRAITRQQFSPDSKVLVVSDLSGFVDCWSLEGEEDLTSTDVEMKEKDDGAAEDSSDDEDSEAETTQYGQYWKTMECSKTLPQLDSAAVVLTFRPSWSPHNALPNGVNHEADSSPHDPYNLFILTTTHQLHEFSFSTGKLTDWSRRNPTSQLPGGFRKIRDRAMGNFWHQKKDALRLYLWGSNWVYMFDVSRDLQGEEQKDGDDEKGRLIETGRKRKWAESSGAGGVKKEEDYQGFRPGVEVTRGGVPVPKKLKIEEERILDKAEEDGEDEISEDNDEDEPSSRALRVKAETEVETGPWKSWYSFSYRPNLVVMPFTETPDYLETVVVERPGWELDLPPRLVGPYDSKSL